MIVDDSKNLTEIITYFDVYAIFNHCFCSFLMSNPNLFQVPSFEDEALGAVFSVLAYLVVFQYMEDFN